MSKLDKLFTLALVAPCIATMAMSALAENYTTHQDITVSTSFGSSAEASTWQVSTTYDGNGGAVCIEVGNEDPTVHFTNIAFLTNSVADKSPGNCGGAVSVGVDCTAFFTNCVFTGNEAKGSMGKGGAVNVTGDAFFSECTFVENTADSGGGIYVGSICTLANVIFRGNTASTDPSGNIKGGALAVQSGRNVFLAGKVTLETPTDTIIMFGTSRLHWDLTGTQTGFIENFHSTTNFTGGDLALSAKLPETPTAARFVLASGDISEMTVRTKGAKLSTIALTGATGVQDKTITVNAADATEYAGIQWKLAVEDNGTPENKTDDLLVLSSLPPEPIEATPAEVANATAVVYTNGYPSAEIAGKSGSWNAWSNGQAKVVYTPKPGYGFADGAATKEYKLDTSVNPAVIAEEIQPEEPGKASLRFGIIAQRYPWDGKVDVNYKAVNCTKGTAKAEITIGEVVTTNALDAVFGTGDGVTTLDLSKIAPETKGKATFKAILSAESRAE